jgi:ATP-dependent RNA circularization protein (DNA/RNA ligase family)
MSERLVKFPRTPHFVWLGESAPRDDKLMEAGEVKKWLARPASVEEKVDGANLGLSPAPDGRVLAQSRGHYLEPGTGGQWKPLWRWLAERQDALAPAIGPSRIVFGEWCYAQHSVFYDALPDWFLLFDVYDRLSGRFWSRERREHLARTAGLSTVPLIATGTFTVASLQNLLGRSQLGPAPAEGLYLRWDDGDLLVSRAKIVRRGWVMASDEHWSSRPLKTNRLAVFDQAHASRGSS